MTIKSLRSNQSGSAFVVVFLVVIIVAIGGAAAFVATKNSDKKQVASKDGSSRQTDKPAFTVTSGSTSAEIVNMLKAAKAGSYDLKCTLDYGDGSGSDALLSTTGKGTMYLSGATKMRLDATIEDKPGHFMRVGDALYIWTDGAKEGSKFPVTKKSSDSSASADKFAEQADKYKMSCQSIAKLDAATFQLPSTVNFVDVNSRMQQSTSGN